MQVPQTNTWQQEAAAARDHQFTRMKERIAIVDMLIDAHPVIGVGKLPPPYDVITRNLVKMRVLASGSLFQDEVDLVAEVEKQITRTEEKLYA